jgi:hypothetical protein
MSDEVRLTIRVPKDLHQAAKGKAADDDVTLSHVVRWYLRAWIEGKAPLFPPSESSEGARKEQE